MKKPLQLIHNYWLGERVFIIGGGPSLKKINIDKIKGVGKVIATNNAFKIAPWADLLLFADSIWYDWNKPLDNIKMPIISGSNKPIKTFPPYITHWPSRRHYGLMEGPGELVGNNAGLMALTLSEWLGAKSIILLGFDLNPVPANESAQWHNDHKRPTNTAWYASNLIPAFEKTAPLLVERCVPVFNVNPDSALRCFPYVPFEDTI